jgi:hypothetical protein
MQGARLPSHTLALLEVPGDAYPGAHVHTTGWPAPPAHVFPPGHAVHAALPPAHAARPADSDTVPGAQPHATGCAASPPQ